MPRLTAVLGQSRLVGARSAGTRSAGARQAAAARRANRWRAMPRWVVAGLRALLWVGPLSAAGLAALWAQRDGSLERYAALVSERALNLSVAAGFSVHDIQAVGHAETDPAQIIEALGVDFGSPILAFDPHAARASLQAIPWIKQATVERRLPDTIRVRIVERTPMALWQAEGRVALIDPDGRVLSDADLERFADLPMLVGPDAPRHGAALLAALAQTPEIAELVQSAVWVGQRRWDLRLDGGIDVRLPEQDFDKALLRLAEAQRRDGILERDMVAVDLRMPDRLVVQTSAMSAELRRRPKEKT